MLAKVGEVADRDSTVAALPRLLQQHHPLRVGHGERPEENGVDDAEDRGVRPNTHRQGENGDDRKCGGLAQDAGTITEILNPGMHGHLWPVTDALVRPFWVAVGRFGLRDMPGNSR